MAFGAVEILLLLAFLVVFAAIGLLIWAVVRRFIAGYRSDDRSR